jgi:hypothetical protein
MICEELKNLRGLYIVGGITKDLNDKLLPNIPQPGAIATNLGAIEKVKNTSTQGLQAN